MERMRTTGIDARARRVSRAGPLLAAALLLGACSSAGTAATSPPTVAPPTVAPTLAVTPVPATESPTDAPTAPPVAGPVIDLGDHPTYGEYLVDAEGNSLYLFLPDGSNVSNCTGNCASSWPPFTVAAGETVSAGEGVTGTIGTIERPNGSMQVTYNQRPLYYFSGDSDPGEVAGQGLNEVWYLVRPSGDAVSAGGRGNY